MQILRFAQDDTLYSLLWLPLLVTRSVNPSFFSFDLAFESGYG